MINRDNEIDDLLKRNVEQQLADFNWGRLTKGIHRRLASAEVLGSSGGKYASLLKVAAVIAVSTTVVFTALVVRMSRPPVTRFAETTGSARVEIKTVSAGPHVTVDIGGRNRKPAKCDIKIIDANGSRRHQDTRAAWMIVSRTERIYADNGFNDDMKDLICLF